MSLVKNKIYPTDRKSAKFAVLNWHYSHSMPSGRLMCFAIEEMDKYVGAIIYGRGANNNIASPYNLSQTDVIELVRVAFKEHQNPITYYIAKTLKYLKNKGIKIIISYADTAQGHEGIIYKAGNWKYEEMKYDEGIIINGKQYHRRAINGKFGTSSVDKLKKILNTDNIQRVNFGGKHKYIYILDKKIKKALN